MQQESIVQLTECPTAKGAKLFYYFVLSKIILQFNFLKPQKKVVEKGAHAVPPLWKNGPLSLDLQM